jgi:hypothetical protein
LWFGKTALSYPKKYGKYLPGIAISPALPRIRQVPLKELGDIEMKRNDPDKALPLQKKPVQLKHDIGIAYSDLGTIFSSENNIRMR